LVLRLVTGFLDPLSEIEALILGKNPGRRIVILLAILCRSGLFRWLLDVRKTRPVGLVKGMVKRLINRVIERLASRLIDGLVGQLVDGLGYGLVDLVIDGLVNMVVDRFVMAINITAGDVTQGCPGWRVLGKRRLEGRTTFGTWLGREHITGSIVTGWKREK
jgi:hypothetical protein